MHRTVVLFGVLLTVGCSPAPNAPAPQSEGSPAPAAAPVEALQSGPSRPTAPVGVDLTILDGPGFDQLVASHRGKVVVVDVWSTSCEPCLKEFPNLVAMSRDWGGDRLACVSLNLDFDGIGRPEDKQAKVLEFLERFGAKFDNVLSSEEADATLERLELFAPPAVLVYDQAGKLSHAFGVDGEFTYAEVRQHVDSLLARPR